MIPNIPREQTQVISFVCVLSGIFLMLLTPNVLWGVAAIGISCWILMISESLMHAKIQIEMHKALDDISRKKEQEVEEVLYFLRQSSISASPFESIEGAKKLCRKIDFPAMVTNTAHQIVSANEKMHKLLGWDPKARDLNGIPVYLINNPAVLSKLGGLATKPEIQDRNSMATSYVYVHKSGEQICGHLVAYKIKNEGFFAVFHPTTDCLISHDEITELLN